MFRLLSDMGQCLPREALSEIPHRSKWHVVSYDAGEVQGRMIVAQALVESPEVTLPIDAIGWHAVTIGVWAGTFCDIRLKYRLSGERIFRVIHQPNELPLDRTEIFETFPFYADLTGQNLVLAKDTSAQPPASACVAYVKIRPLSDEEAETVRKDRKQTDTRRIIALNDGEGLFGSECPRTREELLEQVELYRHSDVCKVLWGVNLGDLTYYPSKVGKFRFAEYAGVYPSLFRKNSAESSQALTDAGVPVPFEAVMKHVHEMGLEFHTYYRLVIADHAHPYNAFTSDSFLLKEHPDWRMVTKDGTPLIKASYAFPEVRKFMVSLIEEGMQYDIDGVNLCFIRGPEYFGYEKPVIDDFRKLYGLDPRNLPDDDERLLDLRTGYMTEFVRAVRRAADKRAAERGRKMQVSAFTEPFRECMSYLGCDGYAWLREGLLDFIIAATPTDLVSLAREKGVKVYSPGTPPWLGEPMETHVDNMKHAYAAGLDGLAVWDLNAGQFLPEKWAVLGRLGHKEDVLNLYSYPGLLPKMRRFKLLSLDGKDFSHTEYKNAPFGIPSERLSVWTGG